MCKENSERTIVKIRATTRALHFALYSLNYYYIIQFVSMIMPLFVVMNSFTGFFCLFHLPMNKLKRYFPLFDSSLIYAQNSHTTSLLSTSFTLCHSYRFNLYVTVSFLPFFFCSHISLDENREKSIELKRIFCFCLCVFLHAQ